MNTKLLFTIALIAPCLAVAAQVTRGFNPGNLCVLRVGDGIQELDSSGDPVYLDEYTTNGVRANSVAVPSDGATALILGGTATSEGALSRSPDQRFVVMAGYNTKFPYTSSLSKATSASVPRGLGALDYNGNFTFITNTAVFFSANNIRSGVTDGSNNFWAVGATNGAVYLGLASPAATAQDTSDNNEVIGIFNGSLCFSTQKGTAGVYSLAGAPDTTNGSASLLFTTGNASSPYAFVISPDNTIAYVADDRAVGSGGGIQKFTNNGGWSLLYTLGTGIGSTVGARGVVASFGQPSVIYATTAEASTNRLISITDTNSASVATVLATAGASEAFRGVQFTPQGAAPSIAVPLQDQTLDVGQPASFSITASGTGALYYLWESNQVALTGWKTNSSFILPTTGDATGAFDVEVLISNSWGTASSQATLTLIASNTLPPAPVISSEPQSLTVNAGGTAVFSVTAHGSPLSYQWQRNGVNLAGGPNVAGAATSELMLSNVFGASSGSYTVVVANSGGAITSTPAAVLTVVDPYLETQPVGGITYSAGQTATFSVGAIGTQLSYLWTFNGVPILGQTNSVLQQSNLVAADAGSYTVLISNLFGVVPSAVAAITVAEAQTAFFSSNLAVLRVGDGTQVLTNSGNTLFLDQWTANGAYVSTMSLPDSGASALVISGVANTEGCMTLSSDGRLLAVPGYNIGRAALAESLSSTSSAAVPRAIGTIDATGAYHLAVTTRTQYSTNNLRSGATDGAGNFWGAGSGGGICYLGTNAGPATIESSIANCRVINVVNGSLVFSTQNGTNNGLYSLGALPTTPAGTSLAFYTAASSAPEDFAFNGAGNLAYVADNSTNGQGGLQRWQLSGGLWTNVYTLGSGAPGIGARSLTVNFSGTTPLIYAVTGETAANRLILITDAGPASPAVTLAVCPLNQLFRAVKFAPASNSSPPPTLSAAALSNRQFSFSLVGVAGSSYVIEASSELLNWVSVQTNIAPFTFVQTNTGSFPQRFYRVVYK